MNAHIWESDKWENGNGRLLKQLAGDLGLHIMNCVWKGMIGPPGLWMIGSLH